MGVIFQHFDVSSSCCMQRNVGSRSDYAYVLSIVTDCRLLLLFSDHSNSRLRATACTTVRRYAFLQPERHVTLYLSFHTLIISSPRLCSNDTGGFQCIIRMKAPSPSLPSRRCPASSGTPSYPSARIFQCTPLRPHGGPCAFKGFHIGNSKHIRTPVGDKSSDIRRAQSCRISGRRAHKNYTPR